MSGISEAAASQLGSDVPTPMTASGRSAIVDPDRSAEGREANPDLDFSRNAGTFIFACRGWIGFQPGQVSHLQNTCILLPARRTNRILDRFLHLRIPGAYPFGRSGYFLLAAFGMGATGSISKT
jgi:hypothetical protein